MSFNSVCNHTRDKQIGLPHARSSDFVNRPTGLHSVLLPLLIPPGLSRPALKTVLLFIYCFYCIRGQFWLIAFRREGKGKEKLVSLIYSNPFPYYFHHSCSLLRRRSLSSSRNLDQPRSQALSLLCLPKGGRGERTSSVIVETIRGCFVMDYFFL